MSMAGPKPTPTFTHEQEQLFAQIRDEKDPAKKRPLIEELVRKKQGPVFAAWLEVNKGKAEVRLAAGIAKQTAATESREKATKERLEAEKRGQDLEAQLVRLRAKQAQLDAERVAQDVQTRDLQERRTLLERQQTEILSKFKRQGVAELEQIRSVPAPKQRLGK